MHPPTTVRWGEGVPRGKDTIAEPMDDERFEQVKDTFFAQNIAFEPVLCFILREKNRKKFQNLLTRTDG
ncbi:MAG: hypothetical protein KatS3mg023_2507 [Armatimonadota bacterium]|nr:MAG: hypothetical protein KatS3mg023_2507 [Armatimonadota bacterium]